MRKYSRSGLKELNLGTERVEDRGDLNACRPTSDHQHRWWHGVEFPRITVSCCEFESRQIQFSTRATGADDDAFARKLQTIQGGDRMWIDKMHTAGLLVDCYFYVEYILSKR